MTIIKLHIHFPGMQKNNSWWQYYNGIEFHLWMVTGLFDLFGGPDLFLPNSVLLQVIKMYLGAFLSFEVTYIPPGLKQFVHLLYPEYYYSHSSYNYRY